MPKKVVYCVNLKEANVLEHTLDLLRTPDQGILPHYVLKLNDKKFEEKISIYKNGQLLLINKKKIEKLRELSKDVARKKSEPNKLIFQTNLRHHNVIQLHIYQSFWDKIKDKLYTWIY